MGAAKIHCRNQEDIYKRNFDAGTPTPNHERNLSIVRHAIEYELMAFYEALSPTGRKRKGEESKTLTDLFTLYFGSNIKKRRNALRHYHQELSDTDLFSHLSSFCVRELTIFEMLRDETLIPLPTYPFVFTKKLHLGEPSLEQDKVIDAEISRELKTLEEWFSNPLKLNLSHLNTEIECRSACKKIISNLYELTDKLTLEGFKKAIQEEYPFLEKLGELYALIGHRLAKKTPMARSCCSRIPGPASY